jgi:chloride channel protein, CIC family
MAEERDDDDQGNRRRPKLIHRVQSLARPVLFNDQLVLLVLAIIAAAAAAYGAIAFRELYLSTRFFAFGTTSEELYTHVASLPMWQRVLAPALGGLVVGLLVRFLMPEQRPQGVPDVMEAVALRSGAMDTRAGIGAAIVSATSIGFGASVGREGPVVHLGAFLSSLLARKIGLSRSQTITLIGCGVAAAVSSSFNAPIAGVFFALEVVIGHYALSAFAPIVIASVVGTMISRTHFGDFPAFIIPDHSSVSSLEFPAFALLGVLSAATAVIFIKSVAAVRAAAQRIPGPAWWRPMYGGVLIGLIAIPLPHVLGVGYGSTDAALKGLFPLELLVMLVAAKLAATAISIGSGFGGGVFSPSLFMGAVLGASFGVVATAIAPEYSSGVVGYTLVGMGAVAGSVLGAPISTILIVFELSADYALTIAVMIGVVVASVITQQFSDRSFFLWQLAIRGIDLTEGRESGLLGTVQVAEVMTTGFATVAGSASMKTVREALITAPGGILFVVEPDRNVLSTITLPDLPEEALDTATDHGLTAGEVARPNPTLLLGSDNIGDALHLMHETGEDHVGVVDSFDDLKLIGMVRQVDVIQTYNRALLKARQEERGEA